MKGKCSRSIFLSCGSDLTCCKLASDARLEDYTSLALTAIRIRDNDGLSMALSDNQSTQGIQQTRPWVGLDL